MFTRFILKNRIDRCPSFWVLLIVMVLIGSPLAQAATFTVTNLNDSGVGSLRQAIIDAKAIGGDNTIQFQSGLSGTILLTSGFLNISSNLVINGPGVQVLTISCSNQNYGRIFNISNYNVTVTLNKLALKNCPSGAIFSHGTLTINNSVLSGNSAGYGGAIGSYGTLTINNSILSGNSASQYGGAIYSTGTLTINNSTLSGNSTDEYGGAIYNSSDTLTINNSTLSGNSADNYGGAIYNSSDTLTINNSTLSGNSAVGRSGDSSSGWGGGLYIVSGPSASAVVVMNSTLTGNSAANYGGGIYLAKGKIGVSNSIVSGNVGRLGKEAFFPTGASLDSQGHNLFGENGNSGLQGATPVASDLVPPVGVMIANILKPLDNYGGPTKTHLPKVGSLVVNAGDNDLVPSAVKNDQRGPGFPRIYPTNGKVDIGAVELGPTYPLAVAKIGGNGLITSNPTGINCGSTCNAIFDGGKNVILTAVPDAGYTFTSWLDDCTGTAPTCTVKMDAAKTVTALFANIPAFTLRVTKIGNGSGTVTSNPAGINCGSDCTESYPTNTLVKLTAAPLNAGSVFVGWSGACAGTATICTVKMDAAKTATANFKRVATLTVAKSGSGAGRATGPNINCGLDCAETYDLNTVVTLTAAAYSGSTLIGWFNCPANPAPNQCRVTMSAARTVTARFNTTTAGKTALTLYKAGMGLGTVTSTPAGINCGPTCPASVFNFATGATVVLTAVETTGSTFTGWSGCTVNPANRRQCTVVLNTGKVVSATFARPVLTVRKIGSGLVVNRPDGIFCGTDCTEPYNLNTVATLIAIPATGYRFNGWSGCTADPGFPQMCTVRMNQSMTATASFIR